MIFNWLENDTLRKEEQLMNIIYDCGMATFAQLREITAWKETALRFHFNNLNQKNKKDMQPDGEKLWLQTHYAARLLSGKSKEAVYTLGKLGRKRVHEIRDEEKKIRDTPVGQLVHFVKTNEVLVRALRVFDREQIRWFSSYAATDLLVLSWNHNNKEKLDRRSSIRPDGKLYIQNASYFIEFDNSTEGPRQVERKFQSYVEVLTKIKDESIVLWVTTSQKRKEYLRRNWEALQLMTYQDQPKPQMLFFVEGEDTNFLLERHRNLAKVMLLP